MPRVALLAWLAFLAPAAAAAQWRGYAPDSAEYRLVMRAGSPGGSIRQSTFTHRAILHARARGSDSLTVSVLVLPSEIDFGDGQLRKDSLGVAAVEVPISRHGMAADPGRPPVGPALLPQMFAKLFVAMAYPRRDGLGHPVSAESDPDSMARLGMRASMRRSTLPDTAVAGVHLSRQVLEMSIQSDSSITVRAGMSPMPAMDMQMRAEQWFDADWRVHRATSRNRVRPRAGAGGGSSVLGDGMDMFLDFERLPLRPR